MQHFGVNELRSRFLDFFKSKNHYILPSFPLVPQDDKSLLIINSGMAPLKPYFTGEKTPPSTRVATCQKAVRVIDIDNVGRMARYNTFFEMLGNFSFGDYFKKESLSWSWEFLTGILCIPQDLLYPSVYIEDDEAFDIWTKEIGLPPEKITRLGKADNFWEHGSGPCGPCSEIYFDRGKENGCGNPNCRPGCDCDRFVEVWNNVFTQFNNDGKGNYTELTQKNIDTGMGLERLAMVVQGVDNLMEIDTMRIILEKVCELTKTHYGRNEESDICLKIITDHIRSSVFMIGDNILPSNEGRGYVLRRVLRRAARRGKQLGAKEPFLYILCDTVVDINKEAYPELTAKRDYIKRILKTEEDRFDATIDAGLKLLEEMTRKSSGTLSGADIFKLYDTFGFPFDLTREICGEKNISLDEDGFNILMKEQKERARAARADISGWNQERFEFLDKNIATEFTGYHKLTDTAKIIALIAYDEKISEINEGDFTAILDRTPFYAESGGQVGDTGIMKTENGEATIYGCKKTPDGKWLHLCRMETGSLKESDTVTLSVDLKSRQAITRNHSAAHLLQSALRMVLGNHVEQAGSYVDHERLRFDFAHFAAMTNEEIRKTEEIVNDQILTGLEITTMETSVEDAKNMGATALFGEKYGDTVRVVKMGGFSLELCGGTHLDNTAKAGLFKIISESSVAAGIRRIEGTTGYGVLEIISDNKKLISDTAAVLKSNNPNEMTKKADTLITELKTVKREIESLNQKLAAVKVNELVFTDTDKISVATAVYNDITVDTAKAIADTAKEKNPKAVIILTAGNNFIAGCGKEAVRAGVHAGNIIKKLAQMAGGSGGGRPDIAVCAVREIFPLDTDILKGIIF